MLPSLKSGSATRQRRFSYAYGVGKSPFNPIYRYHWIGSPIMKCEFLPETLREEEANSLNRISWGTVLHGILASETPAPLKLRETLIGLREKAERFREQYQNLAPSKAPHSGKLTEQQALIVETLQDVGITLHYANTWPAEKLAKLLPIIGSDGLVSKLTVELVTATMQPKWARNAETEFRMRFRKDNFRNVFDDASIRKLTNKKTIGTD